MKINRTALSLSLSTLIVASALFPAIANADTTTTTSVNVQSTYMSNHPLASAAVAARVAARTGLAKTNADNEIDRRVNALNALTTKVNGMKRTSDTQKNTFLTQIQTAITNLTALKAKIDADTDVATLKTDKQSIVTSYRIFALLIPQVTIMADADAELTLAAQMTANDATVQTQIQTLQSAGKNVSNLQSLLSDRQAKIADAQTQAQNALNSVVSLTPDGYPGNKPTLLSARDMLKTARQDLTTAYQDLVQINKAAAAL